MNPVNGHSPLSVAVAYNFIDCLEILDATVVCNGDECIETNDEKQIVIDIHNINSAVKELLMQNN